jgi:hypothetical protein
VLGVGDEDVHGGLEEGWVVETGGGDTNKIVFGIFRAREARAAVGAETAEVVTARDALGVIIFQLPFGDLKGAEWDDNHWQVRSPAELLAVAAVAFQHPQWLGGAFVANRTAQAAAGNGQIHSTQFSVIPGKTAWRFVITGSRMAL